MEGLRGRDGFVGVTGRPPGEGPADTLFGLFMDHNPAVTFLVDPEDRVIWANQSFLAWLGRPLADVAGKHPDEVHGPGAAAQFAPSTRQVLRTGRPFAMEQTVHFDDGREIHLAGHKFPVPQSDGTVLVGGTFVDVSDRVRAERARQEAEERFRVFMKLLPAMAHTKDAGLRYTWANPAYLRTVGRTLDEITGRRAADIWPDAREQEQEEAAVVAEGRPRTFRDRLTLADGSLGHVFGYRFPLAGQGEDAVAGVFVDVTGEVTVRDRMAERETRLAALFERSPIGIAVTGLGGELVDVNPALAGLLESSPAELHGMSLADLTPGEETEREEPLLREMLDGRRSQYSFDKHLIRRSDLSPVPVSVRLTLIRDARGKPQEIIAMVSPRTAPRPPAALRCTEEEIAILTLVAGGASDAQVARTLALGESTVRLRLGALKRRLGAGNRAHLVARAYRTGVLRPDQPSA
ncbi:PAS domain-containing protein [Streptomyces sp. CAU 1734]|uniref:PAS domain-containing protein n=1 Tax=Streptomyces sp. CAU 1734 TaxID=3140360 RepID=UPI0032617FD8